MTDSRQRSSISGRRSPSDRPVSARAQGVGRSRHLATQRLALGLRPPEMAQKANCRSCNESLVLERGACSVHSSLCTLLSRARRLRMQDHDHASACRQYVCTAKLERVNFFRGGSLALECYPVVRERRVLVAELGQQAGVAEIRTYRRTRMECARRTISRRLLQIHAGRGERLQKHWVEGPVQSADQTLASASG